MILYITETLRMNEKCWNMFHVVKKRFLRTRVKQEDTEIKCRVT